MFGVRHGILLPDFADARETRPALEQGAEPRVLLRRAHGENFHTAVTEVADVAADAQFFRGVSGEIAEADALDHAGDEVAFCLYRFAHKPGKL